MNFDEYIYATYFTTNKCSSFVFNTVKEPVSSAIKLYYYTRMSHSGDITRHDTTIVFYKIMHENYQSNNLIYLMECNTCYIKYVGQTKNRTPDRSQGHFFDIKNHKNTTVVRHFARHGKVHNPPNLPYTFWKTSNVQRYIKVKVTNRQKGADLDT